MKIKIALLLILFLVLISGTVHAQSNGPSIPNPPPEGIYILDELDWLTSKQEAEINSVIQYLDNDGLAEIAVVTLDDCGTNKLAFRKSLFETWGIGHVNDNDGLLILVCWYGGDQSRRSVEQEYGPGLNSFFAGAGADRFVQANFVPAFQKGHPGDGLVAMVNNYDQVFRSTSSDQSSTIIEKINIGFVIASIILLLWGIIKFLILNKPANLPKERGKRGTKRRKNSSRSRGGWWFGGDGGSSGYDGGGGFDGGSSDGGGGSSSDF